MAYRIRTLAQLLSPVSLVFWHGFPVPLGFLRVGILQLDQAGIVNKSHQMVDTKVRHLIQFNLILHVTPSGR